MTTFQSPIGSGFNAFSTASHIVAGMDLAGTTAIVTGGYSGLGLETVRALCAAGVEIIVPARDTARALASLSGLPRVAVAHLDLMSPQSIDRFAAPFAAGTRALHLLINCAGVMATPLIRDESGHESHFAINHLGHFRLTARLWPALRRARQARVVSVSSRGHQIAGIDFDDIDFQQKAYDKWIAYGQSKTANALFAVALDARGQADDIRAFSVHPGTVLGPLARHLSSDEIASFKVRDESGELIIAPEQDLKTAAQGAASIVWCATNAQLGGMGGVYCEDCDIASVSELERRGVRPWAIAHAPAERLWALSEGMTGIGLPD